MGISGEPQEDLYVLGLQLSSVQWGTAIAAEAGSPARSGARTVRDADDIAAALLASAARGGGSSDAGTAGKEELASSLPLATPGS